MLRMVFEIVMALAVILCLVFLTKMGSMDSEEDRDQDDSGDDSK